MNDNQAWKQVTLIANGDKAEEISDILFFLDAVSVTYQDAKDDPILEPLPGEQRVWPNTKVIGLFEKGTDTAPVVSYLQHLYGDNFPIVAHDLEDQDWVRAWMDNFKPIKCGKNLWITPSWCETQDGINVILDPGLAFGTGTHPTTFLCLGFLDSLENLSEKEVLDYGCGSGILAISALKLGAKKAYGVDIDPQALIASKDNAQRNQVEDKLELFDGASKQIPQCSIVVANILAGPLAQLEPNIAALCQSQGKLALSGILESQAQEVIDAYSKDFDIEYTKVKEGWVLIVATRK
ncbi:50S ribosomal protein L11 methyltransferase [Anaerobiospirillum sp. NML120448]|uniref:50S ribosomal protein L11 methyltransferase n=1 Tax=Anaerobiospirillum sp. NML120448 TaxID=2932816 RepID=UPI001FF11F5F|nr:50S ribosomal protein L11 methyltransferase [Anaerobiospirillum sp. NML120448]MCK0513633.1 50S ribosomal protein L11 methyltransferase [Anaerobiospirillum sp. NML120448]